MDNGVPIDSVGGSAQEPVNLEDAEEHDAPPHFVCLPPFLPANFEERAGRQAEARVFIIMCATQEFSLKSQD
jgi:hypothetical protein